MVYCKELEAIENEIVLRSQVYNYHILKQGIDGMGSFLKICLRIQENQSIQAKFSSRKKLLTMQSAKDSVIKRVPLPSLKPMKTSRHCSNLDN